MEQKFGKSLPQKYKDFFSSNSPREFNAKIIKNYDEQIFFKPHLLDYCFDGGTYDENYFLYDCAELRYLPFGTYTGKKYTEEGYDDEGGFTFLAVDSFDDKLPIVDIDIAGGEIIIKTICDSIDDFKNILLSKEEANVEKKVTSLLERVRVLINKEQYAEAQKKITQLKEVIKEHPSFITSTKSNYLIAYEGKVLLELLKYQECVDFLTDVSFEFIGLSKLNPHLVLSQSYMALGNFQKAMEQSNIVMKDTLPDPIIQRNHALLLLINQKPEMALKFYKIFRSNYREKKDIIKNAVSQLEKYKDKVPEVCLEIWQTIYNFLTDKIEISLEQENELSDWWNSLDFEWNEIFRASLKIDDEPQTKDLIYLTNEISYIRIRKVDVDNLEPLKKIKNLTRLTVYGYYSSVKDYSALADLTALEKLDLSECDFHETEILNKLINIKKLDLKETKISDICFVQYTKKLEDLNISETKVSDLSPLKNHSSLKKINCSETQVSDASFLATISTLVQYIISDTKINDVSPLSALKNVCVVGIKGLDISDLEFLKENRNLYSLNISNTNITNIDILFNYDKFWLHCRDIKVPKDQIKKLKKEKMNFQFYD